MNQDAKELFGKLELPYPAVAVKYYHNCPEDVEHVDETLSFCQFIKKSQDTGKKFYVAKEDDNCYGKVVLGMEPVPESAASGQIGHGLGVYGTPAANARLYSQMHTLVPGTCNYVVFCPVAICDFFPDLVICVAQTAQAEIIMRATSYISGDLWESRSSPVLSCTWTYSYPYISGKVNFCITGMHFGMKRRKVYPMGLHIISIPFAKLDAVIKALGEMEWDLSEK